MGLQDRAPLHKLDKIHKQYITGNLVLVRKITCAIPHSENLGSTELKSGTTASRTFSEIESMANYVNAFEPETGKHNRKRNRQGRWSNFRRIYSDVKSQTPQMASRITH